MDAMAVTAFLREAKSVDLSAPRAAELALVPAAQVRALVAQHPVAPDEVLRQLALDPSDQVLLAVLENSNTPDDAVALMVERQLELSRCAVRKREVGIAATPDNKFDVLRGQFLGGTTREPAKSEAPTVRVAGPRVLAAILRRLEELPEEFLRNCLAGDDDEVVALVHHRIACMTEVEPDLHEQVKLRILRSDRIPDSELLNLARDVSSDVRVAVAGVAPLPEPVVELLVRDSCDAVRMAVAQRRLPDSELLNLARDVSSDVRVAVAGVAPLPEPVVELLVRDSCDAVRMAVAQRRLLSPMVIRTLLSDEKPDIQHAMVRALLQESSRTKSLFSPQESRQERVAHYLNEQSTTREIHAFSREKSCHPKIASIPLSRIDPPTLRLLINPPGAPSRKAIDRLIGQLETGATINPDQVAALMSTRDERLSGTIITTLGRPAIKAVFDLEFKDQLYWVPALLAASREGGVLSLTDAEKIRLQEFAQGLGFDPGSSTGTTEGRTRLRIPRQDLPTPEESASVRLEVFGTRAEDRVATAQSDRLSNDDMRSLALDATWFVREALAARHDLPDDVVERLSHDVSSHVRLVVASNPQIRPEEVPILASDGSKEVLRALAGRDDLPDQVALDLIAQDDPQSICALIRNPHTSQSVLSGAVQHELARRSPRPPRVTVMSAVRESPRFEALSRAIRDAYTAGLDSNQKTH